MIDRVAALKSAVENDPDNHVLRLMLAEALGDAGEEAQSLDEFERLVHVGVVTGADLVAVAHRALDARRTAFARSCLEAAREAGVVQGLAELDRRVLDAVGLEASEPSTGSGLVPLTFSDVGGLDDVKKLLHRMIILPFVRPELYAKYGRTPGGGVLLYGPPGCGKTMMAKAIAGECGLPFFSVGIHDVVDPLQGKAELNITDIFQAARDMAPSVVFIDEIDALGYARHKAQGEMARRMTNALLQELDGVDRSTEGLLVLAASNAPWDVDGALIRPGRFDRRVFVPPPDTVARRAILDLRLRDVQTEDVDTSALAGVTELTTGADLRAVVERALDAVIDRVLETGVDEPVGQADLTAAARAVRPSALEWLRRARDYVEFSNETGQWSEVEKYLSARSVRRRLAGG